MFGIPGWMELGIIGLVIFLLFGKRIPASMKALGKGIKEFKKGLAGDNDDSEKNIKDQADNDKLDDKR